jgi:hypothetical protein
VKIDPARLAARINDKVAWTNAKVHRSPREVGYWLSLFIDHHPIASNGLSLRPDVVQSFGMPSEGRRDEEHQHEQMPEAKAEVRPAVGDVFWRHDSIRLSCA